ncbi:MAG: alpha-L-fucosidase [Candidatus Latescibacteria bacterium]|nr:alpha-L-fucosidase [Candidatus Latescibacterota bacterium]
MRPTEDTSNAKLQTDPAAVQAYRDARFGLFVHWGVYSLIGHGEWVMHTEKIPTPEYEKLPPRFNPAQFSAEEWGDMMLASGQKYMVITSKHHDGFCMFDSALTEYKITRTPFGRDPIAELAAALNKRGLKLGFYYSLLDWHHPAYTTDWGAYVKYYQGQVRELCTRYGDLALIWFDGYWPNHEPPGPHFVEKGSWDLAGTYDLIHQLQPKALVGNNHHVPPLKGEDFQMFEQDLPGENTAGFNSGTMGKLPLESCLTINKNWGYNPEDHHHKSTAEVIRFLAECIGRDSNLLLNVGPTPLGTIQPEHVERLRGVGQWLRTNGESIYGTRPLPKARSEWGYAVHNPATGKAYLHILDWPGTSLNVEVPKVATAALLASGKPVPARRAGNNLILTLPTTAPDPADTVVVLS